MYEKFELLLRTKKIKVSDVSKATGISTSTFTDWKKGRYTPKADKLKAIANFFGVSIDYFIDENSSSASFILSQIEQSLILLFRQLNNEGQEKALSYMDDLVASGRYIKNCSNGFLEEKS